MRIRPTGFAAVVIMSACSGACVGPDASTLTTGTLIADPQPAAEDVATGRRHYAVGEFGLAEKHFKAAVEANRKNADAWLGLAATYDRLARFDLAERAYAQVVALVGRPPEVANNLGYHYLLQGKTAKARELLTSAAAQDSKSPEIANNVALLDRWKTE